MRVHDIAGGVTFALDYSPAASGMVYRNDANPAGVTIDGVPDTVTPGPCKARGFDKVDYCYDGNCPYFYCNELGCPGF